MTKVVIIDDEKDVVNSMRMMLLENFSNIEVVGSAHSVINGIKEIKSKHPDLVFLDVSMPDANGFDLLDCLPEREFQTIFVTAHDNFAIRAIKAQALDYLLKPVDIDDLIMAVNRATRIIGKENSVVSTHIYAQEDQRIAISAQEGFYYMSLKKIIHFKAEGSYTMLFSTEHKPMLVSRHLKEFENALENKGFCRVHKSHLINITHVDRFLREDGGYAVMSDNTRIEISRNRREEFMKVMGINL
jgi:two-component system, LytTR family, response regulator